MNEDDDLLSFSLRQATTNFTLKRGNRLLMRGHNIRRAPIAGGSDLRWIRNLGKPANFLNSAELDLSHGSGGIRLAADIDRSKTQSVRALGPVGERVRLGIRNWRPVGDVKKIEIVGCVDRLGAIDRCSILRSGDNRGRRRQ